MAKVIDFHSRAKKSDAKAPEASSDPRGSAVPPIPPVTPPGPAASAPTPRSVARDLYLRIRPKCADPTKTVQALVRILTEKRDIIPPEAPPGDLTLIQEWAQADGWERAYQRQQQLQPLDDDNQRAMARVEQCRIFHQAAISALEEHVAVSREMRGETWTKMFASLAHQVQRWDVAVQAAEETLRQMVLERQTEETRARGEEVYQYLLKQYDGLGPQYEVLCRRIAELTVRMEQANLSGRVVTTDEYARMTETYMRAVGQLQKYTETTKSESVSKETQEIVKAALRVVEDIVAPIQPQLWAKALRAVEAKIGAKPREEAVS